jgi:Raf kinase inhibitor-like YbhB/YbcL family protein
MICGWTILVLLAGLVAGIGWMRIRYMEDVRYHAGLRRTIILRSDAFPEGGHIPEPFTCKGEGSSPPLTWSNLPTGTKSLALLVTDEDLPAPTFPFFNIVHWGLYDVPGKIPNCAQGLTDGNLKRGQVRQIPNWSRRTGYYPPCPLYGDHRYAFRIYALDVQRIGGEIRNRDALLAAMKGRILAYGELNGHRRR